MWAAWSMAGYLALRCTHHGTVLRSGRLGEGLALGGRGVFVLTCGLLAFLWRIVRLSASFGVLVGSGSGSFLTQEQNSSSRSCVSQGEGVCKQQHSMQITTPCPPLVGIRGNSLPYWEPPPNPTRPCGEPRCLKSTHVLVLGL
jgi:hypothetical protein